MIFLSDGRRTDDDGIPITDRDFSDEVSQLESLGVNLNAFGVGNTAELGLLQILDPAARRFASPDELLPVFSGLDRGALQFIEPGRDRVEVYLDGNNNGRLDPGEVSTRSAIDNPATPEDETGNYQFADVQPDSYILRQTGC